MAKRLPYLQAIRNLARVHTALELANFSAGQGNKPASLPYQIIGMDSTTGDSKRTMGWDADRDNAIARARDMKLSANYARDDNRTRAGGAEYHRNRHYTFYVRDVRTGEIYGV